MHDGRTRGADWVADEPGVLAACRELARLARRGARRPGLVALATAAVVALTGALAWRRPPHHHAQRVLRVTEPHTKQPTASRDVRGFLEAVAFTNDRLLALVRAHRLANLDHRGADPLAAIADVRDAMTIEVIRSPTIALLPQDERPNATRVVIGYESTDGAEANAVVDDLVRLVMATEQHRTIDAAEANERAAQIAVALAARARMAPRNLHELELARADATVHSSLTRERIGLEFDLVPPAPSRRPLARGAKTAIAAGLALVMGLPLCVLLVAAFDPRIYFEGDLASLGLTALAHVPQGVLR